MSRKSTVMCFIQVLSSFFSYSLCVRFFAFSLGGIHFICAVRVYENYNKPVSAIVIKNLVCYRIFYRLIKKMCTHCNKHRYIHIHKHINVQHAVFKANHSSNETFILKKIYGCLTVLYLRHTILFYNFALIKLSDGFFSSV